MRRAIFVPLLIILAVVAILGGVGYWVYNSYMFYPVKLLVRSLAHQERRHLQLPRRSAAPLMVLSCRYRPYKARVSLPA